MSKRTEIQELLCPGTTLGNGATVVAMRMSLSGHPVVLAIANGGTDAAEYVTWEVATAAETDSIYCYWGHYHRLDLAAAVEDFTARTSLT